MSFWKSEAFGQTKLPERSILKGQKLVENAEIKKSNATFWNNVVGWPDFLDSALLCMGG